jgi:hypothetical protein
MVPQRFPITVDLVREPLTLYRACHASSNDELIRGMRSNYDAERPPHPSDLKATVLHMAVSMFEDAERVASFARQRPERLGTHVAAVGLQPGLGICIADTSGPGHWSVWARPEVLVSLVTGMQPVQD